MSSPGLRPHDIPRDRPPAATTGSPGTAIFSPPAARSSRSLVSSGQPSSSTQPRPLSPTSATQRDRVPVQWSFESSYGLFGSVGGTALPPTRSASRNQPREVKEHSVLGGSWFGRKRDKDKNGKNKGKGKANMDRAKSVDPPETRVLHASAPPPLTHVVTPPPSPDPPPSLPLTPSPPARASTPAPTRPARSPLRPSTAHASSAPTVHPLRDPTTPTFTRRSIDLASPPRPSAPAPARPHISSTPLPAIPASNAPSPRASRSPSPTIAPRSHPPPSFRPTSAHRPGSSAGFKPTRPIPAPAPVSATSTKSELPQPPLRRPATSSGIPASHGPDPTFFRGGIGLYGAGTPFLVSAARESKASLASAQAPTRPPAPPRKETSVEMVKRRRRERRQRGFVMKGGKRHHPRPREEAPYPRDYERKVLDHDVWEHAFARQMANSVTYHTFTTPPAKVLDLGCGTGNWILDCAREWKETHFVGVDLVPIQPDLARVDTAAAPRVRWVLANILERLPFADAEFDYVHVRRVARGVPEDRWDALFEEITRVLRPGGAFELVEEDLFFPGSAMLGCDATHEEERVTLPPTPPRTTPSPSPPDAHADYFLEPKASDRTLRTSRANSDRSPTPARARARRRYSPSFLPDTRSSVDSTSDFCAGSASDFRAGSADFRAGFSSDFGAGSASDFRASSDFRSSASDARPSTSAGTTPPPRPANPTPTHAHSPSMLGEALPRMSLDSWHARGPSAALTPRTDDERELFHASTNPVANPRDHSVLERAYNEMHAARFINLAPLSVLNSALGLHFKDVRSHPPIQLAFPPPANRQLPTPPQQLKNIFDTLPSPRISSSSMSSTSTSSTRALPAERQPSTNSPAKQMLPRSKLYDHSQHYVTLDTDHQGASHLPNQSWSFDMSTLHMHLSARVAEVLACAEEMWEFIVECRRGATPAGAALAGVGREEWEDCLARYELDMQDKIGLAPAMGAGLAWNVRATPRTPEKKAFDEAVKKWERQSGRGTRTRTRHAQPLSRTLRVFVAWKGP